MLVNKKKKTLYELQWLCNNVKKVSPTKDDRITNNVQIIHIIVIS